jgi:hypothetical protein
MPEIGDSELCECRVCGAKSAWAKGFVTSRTLLRGSHTVCLTCRLYRRKYQDVYVSWGTWAALVLLAAYWLTASLASAVLFALALYAISYVAVVAHELGHAATALAVGFRVPAFSLGGGLHVKILSWRDTFVLLGPSPIEGLVTLHPPTGRHYRKKMALVLLAGPSVNLLCAWLGLYLTDEIGFTHLGSAMGSIWIGVHVALLFNLLPLVWNGSFGPLRSDGLQLLDLLSLRHEDIERRVADARAAEAIIAFYYGAFDRAYAIFAPRLDAGDVHGRERVLATAVLIGAGRTHDAIALTRRYLGSGEGTLEERATLMNNLAWALVDPTHTAPTPAELAEAEELSARALEVLPMANAVRGTRGAVLVAKGLYRDAVEILSDKRFRLEPPPTRATVKASLALALAGAGDTAAALRILEAAAKLDASNAQVAKARERISLPAGEALSYDTPTYL